MSRSPWFRASAVLVSAFGFLIGCGSETPTEGPLPQVKVGTPEDMANLQKKLEQEKVGKGAVYKPPPNVQMPKK